MKYLKIYGLQRSGTNYLKALVEENFDVRVLQNIGGWKHGQIDPKFISRGYKGDFDKETVKHLESLLKSGDIPIIHIYKNPFAWIYSYRKYLHNMNRKDMDISTMMIMYNSLNTHWKYKSNYSIDYERLLTDYKCADVLDFIGKLFSIPAVENPFITDIPYVMGRGDDSRYDKYVRKNKKFDKNFYLQEKYMDSFSEEEIKEIKILNSFYNPK